MTVSVQRPPPQHSLQMRPHSDWTCLWSVVVIMLPQREMIAFFWLLSGMLTCLSHARKLRMRITWQWIKKSLGICTSVVHHVFSIAVFFLAIFPRPVKHIRLITPHWLQWRVAGWPPQSTIRLVCRNRLLPGKQPSRLLPSQQLSNTVVLCFLCYICCCFAILKISCLQSNPIDR